MTNKVTRHHTHHYSFSWQSDLSDERKDELIAWVAGLSEQDATNLNDLIVDISDQERDDAAQREAGEDW